MRKIVLVLGTVILVVVYLKGVKDGEMGALKKCYRVYKSQVPWQCS